MKKILILLAFIAGFVLSFVLLKGMVRIIVLCILFPLFFFYCPLLFMKPKEEEKTNEAKREEEGRFGKWY